MGGDVVLLTTNVLIYRYDIWARIFFCGDVLLLYYSLPVSLLFNF